MGARHSTAIATIASGQTTSGAVWIGDKYPAILQMPATFTGATVSFQGSVDLSTYQAIQWGGSLYTETVTASKNVVLSAEPFLGFSAIKIVSASSEAADRTITVIKRSVAK